MDSREPPQPPPPSQQLQSMAQQQPQSAAPNMMMGHTSYASVMPNPNTSSMISANSNAATAMMAPTTARFPFNAGVPQPSAPSKPVEHLNNNSSPYDGSSSAMRPCGFNIDAAKKKRGRPRKYSPDGNIALGLAPTPMSSSAGQGDSNGTPSTDPASKKHRGRPPGSGKKQMDALGSAGVGFTPHVILVKAGEDIAAKIMAFSQQGPRTVCILSANGAIGNVSLRQAATSGGTVQYEGRFEIISLSGSFLPYDDNSGRSRAGGLSVSLAGSDGKVLGGGVAGMLIAASPVQVIVGSFIADGKKSSSNILKSGAASSGPASQMLNFGGPMTPTSPTSQGPSSESSDDNDNNSAFNRGPGLYNNASQPIHNMQMYHPQLWARQSQP